MRSEELWNLENLYNIQNSNRHCVSNFIQHSCISYRKIFHIAQAIFHCIKKGCCFSQQPFCVFGLLTIELNSITEASA